MAYILHFICLSITYIAPEPDTQPASQANALAMTEEKEEIPALNVMPSHMSIATKDDSKNMSQDDNSAPLPAEEKEQVHDVNETPSHLPMTTNDDTKKQLKAVKSAPLPADSAGPLATDDNKKNQPKAVKSAPLRANSAGPSATDDNQKNQPKAVKSVPLRADSAGPSNTPPSARALQAGTPTAPLAVTQLSGALRVPGTTSAALGQQTSTFPMGLMKAFSKAEKDAWIKKQAKDAKLPKEKETKETKEGKKKASEEAKQDVVVKIGGNKLAKGKGREKQKTPIPGNDMGVRPTKRRRINTPSKVDNTEDGREDQTTMSAKAKGKRKAKTVEVKDEVIEEGVPPPTTGSCSKCAKVSAECIVLVPGAACKRCNGQKTACSLTDKSKRKQRTRQHSTDRSPSPQPSTSAQKPAKRRKIVPEPEEPKAKKRPITITVAPIPPTTASARLPGPSKTSRTPGPKVLETVIPIKKRKRSETLVEPANATDESNRGKCALCCLSCYH